MKCTEINGVYGKVSFEVDALSSPAQAFRKEAEVEASILTGMGNQRSWGH